MHFAAERGDKAIIEIFLKEGGDPLAKTSEGLAIWEVAWGGNGV